MLALKLIDTTFVRSTISLLACSWLAPDGRPTGRLDKTRRNKPRRQNGSLVNAVHSALRLNVASVVYGESETQARWQCFEVETSAAAGRGALLDAILRSSTMHAASDAVISDCRPFRPEGVRCAAPWSQIRWKDVADVNLHLDNATQ